MTVENPNTEKWYFVHKCLECESEFDSVEDCEKHDPDGRFLVCLRRRDAPVSYNLSEVEDYFMMKARHQ